MLATPKYKISKRKVDSLSMVVYEEYTYDRTTAIVKTFPE